MMKIGLMSDTHGFIHPRMFDFFADCNEIWHAGDFGNSEVALKIKDFKPLRGVFGNIDGQDIRLMFPRTTVFFAEEVKVLMTHIGGYPGHYEKDIREGIIKEKPAIFISGHSHILKVMYDKRYETLHINPGAAGINGFHKSVTMIRLVIEGNNIRDLEVLDIPRNKE